MIYRFSNGQDIELHYRRKGATMFDAYDDDSLAALSTLTGLTVTRAHDSEYPGKRKRTLWIDCAAPAPFTFAVTGGIMQAQATVDVLEDEAKPEEIDTHRGRQKTLKQIREEIDREATAAAAFHQMIADYEDVYGGDPENQEDE